MVQSDKWRIDLHEEFDLEAFLTTLGPPAAAYVVVYLREIVTDFSRSLAGTHAVRPLGGGLFELRLRAQLDSSGLKLLIRIFFAFRPGRRLFLLSAYDKGRDPTKQRQAKEIAKARKILRASIML